MKKGITLLGRGLFEKPFMDTKAKTRSMTGKELAFGHLIGPLGLIFVVNTIAALVEKFFTQQTGAMYGTENIEMIKLMGERYEVIMTVARIGSVLTGLLIGWLLQHTRSRQGRMRPWHLIFGFASIAIGFTIFLFSGSTLGENYWFYFFTLVICYNTVGSMYFYLFRDTICSLTTRSPSEKARVQFFRKLSWTLLSGIIIGMLVNMVVLPMWLEHDINGYAQLMIALSVVAIPLLFLEYFYTNERVIEDETKTENNIPVLDQIKALVTNKYYLIFIILMTISGIVDNFKGGNVQYFYIKYLLGGADNPGMFTIYQVLTGIPVGIGIFAVYPLSKKIGIKNISLIGYALVFASSLVGWMFADNVTVAMIAGFVKGIGLLPNSYITVTLLCYAFDSVEHKSGLRLEGLLGVSIITALQNLLYAPFAGGYESSILKLGFVDVVGVVPSEEVISFMAGAFYLTDVLLGLAYVVLLPFMDVEQHLPTINRELTERRKQKALAAGEEWIEPEELLRREREEAERQHELDRIHDLRERCEKRGLDFDTENQKYLDRKAKKEAKRASRSKK